MGFVLIFSVNPKNGTRFPKRDVVRTIEDSIEAETTLPKLRGNICLCTSKKWVSLYRTRGQVKPSAIEEHAFGGGVRFGRFGMA
jgi:hypothetical protein